MAVNSRKGAVKGSSTLYNYHLILDNLNKRKHFILNGVPRFLVNPYSVMPRNYVTNNDTCEIRYNKSTNYPWNMVFVDWRGANAFPMFTPVVPEPIQYTEMDYDLTEVYVHTQDPAIVAERLQQQQLLQSNEPAKIDIPAANDYENTLNMNQQFDGIPLKGFQAIAANRNNEEQSICKNNNSRMKFVLTNDPDQFFEPNRNDLPAPFVAETNDMQSYIQYLNSQGGTNTNSLNNVPVTPVVSSTKYQDINENDSFGLPNDFSDIQMEE